METPHVMRFFRSFSTASTSKPYFHWPKPPWPRILGDRFKRLVKPDAISATKKLLWCFGSEDFSSSPQNTTKNILQNTLKLVGSKKYIPGKSPQCFLVSTTDRTAVSRASLFRVESPRRNATARRAACVGRPLRPRRFGATKAPARHGPVVVSLVGSTVFSETKVGFQTLGFFAVKRNLCR